MNIRTKATVNLTTATSTVAEVEHRGQNMLFVEHQFAGGKFDEQLLNSDGSPVTSPDVIALARNAVHAAPENVA